MAISLDQAYQTLSGITDYFQKAQAQIAQGIALCPTDKELALANFNQGDDKFDFILEDLTKLQREVKDTALLNTISSFKYSVAQAKSDGDLAKRKCQQTPNKVTQEPEPPKTEEKIESTDDPNSNTGLPGEIRNTQAQASLQDTTNFEQAKDWRVRLALSPGANYLYKVPKDQAGILAPLQETDGVIFPYTPNIQINYAANYGETAPTHSNYKIFQYQNSAVENISINCEFTAQDTFEANYLLAVIHFFRSVTKMYYGQDQNPKPGTPPPLCYLFGLGEFQFNAHPLLVTSFNYNLPNNVDYIRAGKVTTGAGVNQAPQNTTDNTGTQVPQNRLAQGAAKLIGNIKNRISPGGALAPPNFGTTVPPGTVEPTYVPTRMQIQINCLPVISRNEISNNFSVKNYATGELLRGVKRAGGGFW